MEHSSLDLMAIIEAMIFASKEPLTAQKIFDALNKESDEEPKKNIFISQTEIKNVLAKLFIIWQDDNRPLARGVSLIESCNGYTFVTDKKLGTYVAKVVADKPKSLSNSQIETLGIITYRQPVTKLEIDEIRGVDSSQAIKKLLELKIIKILGRLESLGKPLLYGTSKQFLEFFSLNSLHDLPSLEQYKSIVEGQEEEEPKNFEKFSIHDLFPNDNNSAILSDKVIQMSDQAMNSLNKALSNVEKLDLDSGENYERKNSKSTSKS